MAIVELEGRYAEQRPLTSRVCSIVCALLTENAHCDWPQPPLLWLVTIPCTVGGLGLKFESFSNTVLVSKKAHSSSEA